MKKILKIIFFFIIVLSIKNTVFALDALVVPDTTTQATESTSGLSPYEPLAPIPGISGKTINSDSFALSSYVRNVVRIAIGVIGILAVVMIIIGGVQYMSTDAYTGKESGKETVTKAIGGLILALASVLILRTINPQLTSLELTDQFKMDAITAKDIDIPNELKGEFEKEDIITATDTSCKGGMTTINTVNQSSLNVCTDVANNFKNMVEAAKKDGIILTASGGRTMEAQIALRKKNCGGTSKYIVYEKPSSSCNPPTARPGKSMHQLGLAFDIGENGKTICFPSNSASCKNKGNKAFLWLEKNAGKYGLINLPSEAWHWSVNGR